MMQLQAAHPVEKLLAIAVSSAISLLGCSWESRRNDNGQNDYLSYGEGKNAHFGTTGSEFDSHFGHGKELPKQPR
jgi:hypothetical protein